MKGFIKHNVQLNVRCAAISILMIPIKNGNFVIFSIYSCKSISCYKDKISNRPTEGYEEVVLPDELTNALSCLKDDIGYQLASLICNFVENHRKSTEQHNNISTAKIKKPGEEMASLTKNSDL